MRKLYTLVFYLLLPVVLFRLWWRGRRQPGYRHHWRERLGYYTSKPGHRIIWLHAVSVGETRAAQPLVAALSARYPGYQIVLTQMTPTGRETALAVYGDQIEAVYLAYDLPGAVSRFLSHFRPAFGLLMETELWPNLIHAAHQSNVPLFLVNARLSERSALGYAKIRRLIQPALRQLTHIAAQSIEDANRFRHLGAERITVCGNIKFDVALPPEQIMLGQRWRQLLNGRPVIVVGSSRDGEEAMLVRAWAEMAPVQALLVIVPRHPQRFDEVAAEVARSGMSWARRSQTTEIGHSCQVWLGDSMGELYAYYAMADLAIIGGGFAELGGQNLIEPCATGCPVIVGPHMYNFAETTRLALAAGAAKQVETAEDAIMACKNLFTDPASLQDFQTRARQFAAAHTGATWRTLALLPDPVA
ncbi:lipid IV(A) 3-deoxy-D-manno-octulosonic acid transferase [Chitinivorax sp. B]|uniref:lipid IV(A) 3-deoxy-D-manno-octulosonic acid transferase n=1 Tax=Chitinivorax sp. B TaxID=2502235 RepID=UPI0010FA5CA2|nr:lipid IV(A) 3-deoxy-D-manno-octulosonic acid transferase [Chitinivorax sp. B]